MVSLKDAITEFADVQVSELEAWKVFVPIPAPARNGGASAPAHVISSWSELSTHA